METIQAFNIRIHPLFKKEFLNFIDEKLRKGTQPIIIQHGLNAASIVEAVNNLELREVYNTSQLINIDGYSVVWALRFLGFVIPERVACPDLATDILELAEKNGYSVYFLGASEENLLLAIKNLLKVYPKLSIAGYRNGFYSKNEETNIVEVISETRPDILLIGMSSPQKELFSYKYKSVLNTKYILGVGGYFDILAGKTKRAPLWMQNIGLEWFFRFTQEPKRMWRRYFLGNSQFIWIVANEKFKNFKKVSNS